MGQNKPSYIIIGAAGFMGAAFSAYLRERDCKVFEVLKSRTPGAESDFGFISQLIKDNSVCTIIDFAYTSVPNSSFNDPVRDYSDNLYNVIRHLEFAKQLKRSTYVYISSGGTVYGNPHTDVAVAEDHTNTPLSPYGITKLTCEKYALMYKEVHGLNIKIVRPSNIYGPGQLPFRGQGIVPTAVANMLRGKPVQVFGSGLQVRDYLYIDDFCTALDDIINYGEEDIYNAGVGNGCNIIDLLGMIALLLDVPLMIEALPDRPFDVRYNVLDTSKLKALRYWNPKMTLKEGLEQNIAWIKQQNLKTTLT